MALPESSSTVKPMITEYESDPKQVDSLEEPPSSASCIFCLRVLPSGTDPLSDGSDAALRKKIEFVLVAKLRSLKVSCCSSCIKMFDLFYGFKKSCLLALSKKEELLQAMAMKDAERKYAEEAKKRKCSQVDGKILKCSVCSKEFTDEDEHSYHINEHFGVKPFKCKVEVCSKSFTNPKDCFIHEAMCLVAPPILECNICSFCFATEDELEAHKTSHGKPKFQCPRCSTAFYYKRDWETHVQDCQFKVEDPLESIKVEYSSEDEDEEIIAEEIDGSEISDLGKNDEKIEEQPKEKPTEKICKHCDQSFPLAKNIFRYHQRKCKPTANKPLQCSHCEKTFFKKSALETHLNKVAGIQSYVCRKPNCGKTFFGPSARYSHEESCGMQNFVCDICGTTLGSPGSLRSHRRKHEEQFACELCDKQFKTKVALQKHASTHSEERKFECATCGKRFKSAEANRVHQRIHTQEKPYACPECGERFTYNCSLKAHLDKKACFRR